MAVMPRYSTDSVGPPSEAVVLAGARSDLDQLVQRFEEAAKGLGVEPPTSVDLRNLCNSVAAFTAELFPGKMRLDVKNDPEIPDDIFFRFAVDATGAIADIAARNDEWHARVCGLPARFSGMFRLSIAVR